MCRYHEKEAPDGFGCGAVVDLLQLNMQTMAKKPPLQFHGKAPVHVLSTGVGKRMKAALKKTELCD